MFSRSFASLEEQAIKEEPYTNAMGGGLRSATVDRARPIGASSSIGMDVDDEIISKDFDGDDFELLEDIGANEDAQSTTSALSLQAASVSISGDRHASGGNSHGSDAESTASNSSHSKRKRSNVATRTSAVHADPAGVFEEDEDPSPARRVRRTTTRSVGGRR